MVILHLNIKAGMAISGPPLGPTLGQYGIAIGPFCDSFNEKTTLFKNTYPLNVYLHLNKDGSYDYYLYFPRLIFFLKKLLKKENGPAETPKYLYFLGYIIVKASMVKKKNSEQLSLKIYNIFKDNSLEVEKINFTKRYKNIFRKGSFRSITPELLFETITFYSIKPLEIMGFFNNFFELRDYFIIDYTNFFFFFDYINMHPVILSEFNLEMSANSFNFIQTRYNIHFLFSKHNSIYKIIDLLPMSIDLYYNYIKLNKTICRSLYTAEDLYYYTDLLCESNRDLNFCFDDFIGFDFNFDLALRNIRNIENPLFLLMKNIYCFDSFTLKNIFNIEDVTNNFLIFTFSMYTTTLYFSQYECYANYDFRNIAQYELYFKQINSYLRHLGIFLIGKKYYFPKTKERQNI